MESVILALLIAHSAPNAIPAPVLAKEIALVSKEYKIDALTLARIVLQESKGNPLAYNATSSDHGLVQINQRTAIGFNTTVRCLYNWRCNLRLGAKLIASQKKNPRYRPCMYNVGVSGASKNIKACVRYEQQLMAFN